MSPSPTVMQPTTMAGNRGGRARQRAETRERLFEAALKEFREYGFAGAQIDRIAKAAGVVRGTFYFHFPSKDDVLIELARRINVRIARRVAVLGGATSSLRDLLRRVNDAITDEHTRVGEAGLQAELLSLYMRRPHYANGPGDHNAPSLASELAGHLETIEARGGINTRMTKELAAVVFLTSLFGIYVRIPPGESRRVACDALIDLFVAGLEAPPSGETGPRQADPRPTGRGEIDDRLAGPRGI
jgi:AcrR family transcriptional regulator